MKSAARLLLAVLAVAALETRAARAQAPRFDIELAYVWSMSTQAVDGNLSNVLDYSSGHLGGGVNLRWDPKFSALFCAWGSDATLRLRNVGGQNPGAVGVVNVNPLAFILQWHPLGPTWIDPYAGIGGALALVSTGQIFAPNAGFGLVSDDQFAFVANAGVRINVLGNLGVLLDAKYLPLNLQAEVFLQDPPADLTVDLEADQFALSFGLSVRF